MLGDIKKFLLDCAKECEFDDFSKNKNELGRCVECIKDSVNWDWDDARNSYTMGANVCDLCKGCFDCNETNFRNSFVSYAGNFNYNEMILIDVVNNEIDKILEKKELRKLWKAAKDFAVKNYLCIPLLIIEPEGNYIRYLKNHSYSNEGFDKMCGECIDCIENKIDEKISIDIVKVIINDFLKVYKKHWLQIKDKEMKYDLWVLQHFRELQNNSFVGKNIHLDSLAKMRKWLLKFNQLLKMFNNNENSLNSNIKKYVILRG